MTLHHIVMVALLQSPPGAPQDNIHSCLPQSALVLAGIRLGTSQPEVNRVLGEPRAVERDSSEDDGGRFEVVRLKYDSLQIELGRGAVQRLATTSTHYPTFYGIRVGMRLKEVAAALRMPDAADRLHWTTLSVDVCDNPGSIGADLKFARTVEPRTLWRLVSIELTEYGP
jgi:hypothetical protein